MRTFQPPPPPAQAPAPAVDLSLNTASDAHGETAPRARLRVVIRGAVQGVGFRPFVFRLASELALSGWVNNSPQGVFLEAEGDPGSLNTFLLRLESRKPPLSSIQSLEASWLDPLGGQGFVIRPSDTTGQPTALVLPDIATCPDCLREVFDPANRRFRYPFTNCTHCGPRFSIIQSLPYDRANTSMHSFPLCPLCQAEFDDPRDRRFHAQPNACPACGPRLQLWSSTGLVLSAGDDALRAAAEAIRRGLVVAAKGLGGFHLLVDARNDVAVNCLRRRKHREEKPLALMFPSLDSIKAVCRVSPLEERLLRSPEAPIALLRRLPPQLSPPLHIAAAVAPANSDLGVMLPSTPLHHLLLADLAFPVVATSGNLSDEPICTDEHQALIHLRGIADLFLVHNRPILRHVDDSIVRVLLDREMVLRRARGYAPLPITLKPEFCHPTSKTVLAVGAHLKNTVALAVGPRVFISQHIGDLDTEAANSAFHRVIADFENLYAAKPDVVVSDLHPDYLSTRYASELRGPRHIGVQHHLAHVFSCLAENEISPPALGVSWDGTGLGLDGAIWGGEFFLVTRDSVQRVAHWRPFPLPGGDQAVKEPRRVALGLLHAVLGNAVFDQVWALPPLAAFSKSELATLRTMLDRGLHSPMTSSAGRLFDAVASLTGLRQQTHFEGQAAMELEFALDGIDTDELYQVPFLPLQPPLVLDWSPMIDSIVSDVHDGVRIGVISAKFHNALAESIVQVARRVGQPSVALSGGCFQNRYLTERAVRLLRAAGFRPYWHQRVPPNDGGLALGQIVAASREKA